MILSGCAVAFSPAVFAQTAMKASAKMAPSCEISAPDVALGEVGAFKVNLDYNKDFNLTVKCSKGVAYQINNPLGAAWYYFTGAASGPSDTFAYSLLKWANGSWYALGSAAQGGNWNLYGYGTGALQQYALRVLYRFQTQLPTPDQYTASSTVEITF